MSLSRQGLPVYREYQLLQKLLSSCHQALTFAGKVTVFHSEVHQRLKAALWSAALSTSRQPPKAQMTAKTNWCSTSLLSGGGAWRLESCSGMQRFVSADVGEVQQAAAKGPDDIEHELVLH